MFKFKRGELDKLDKQIKKYNRKINELKRKGFHDEYLPEKLNYYKVVERIQKDPVYTRKDMQDQFKLMDVVLNKRNEKLVNSERGAVIPQFEKKQIEIKVKAINRRRKAEREKLDKLVATDRNKPIEVDRDLNPVRIVNKKFNFKNMSKKDLEMYLKTMREFDETDRDREERYRENFYKAMRNTLTDEEYKRLKLVIDKIPTDKLLEKYYTDENMNIGFYYEPADHELKYEQILESWNSMIEDRKLLQKFRGKTRIRK
jgi:hypothetical protein